MEKLPESEIKVENKVVGWFKNYWYYYKWRVIAVAFIAVGFLFFALDKLGKKKDK